MASRSQGVLLGCLLVAAPAALGILFFGFVFGGLGETLSALSLAGGRVGLVEITGPIDDATAWVDELEAHRRDGTVRAVVVRVDSPGGAVGPSQELHSAVRRLAGAKPVVASLGAVAASGGYYAIVDADSILANPGTLTGSIGVIFSFPTAVGLMEKIGVRYWTYKSGSLKDFGSFSREPTEEDERVLDALVGDVYEQFLEAVMAGRGIDRVRATALADGRVFTGRQAVELGLVDGLGDAHDAVALAARLGGLGDAPTIVRKSRPRLPLLDLLERLLGAGARIDAGPRLEYRWR